MSELLWKPINVPLACTLDVSDNQLESFKIESCYCIKRYVKQNQSPFKESIDRVGYGAISTWKIVAWGEHYLLQPCGLYVE